MTLYNLDENFSYHKGLSNLRNPQQYVKQYESATINFFQCEKLLLKKFDFNKWDKNEIQRNYKEKAVLQCPMKSILRPMVFVVTTRHRES